MALTYPFQSNKFPSQLDTEAIICGRAAFDSGEKDSIKGGNLPKGPIPKCTINPIGSPRPRSLRKPDGPEPVRKARPKERDKWIDAIRNHWLEYFKKISRKLLSTITTNTAAGNKWKIVNVDPIVNLTSMEIPKQLSSPQNMFQGIMNRPEDGEGDITGLLDQVVSLTPIGPLVHRTEVDLNFDLEQVAQLFFVSPRRSTTQLSSAGRDDIPHVTASQSRTGQPITTDMGATDPLKAFLLDRPPQKGKSYIREGLKEHNLVFQPLHSPKLFKDAFIFWLATALRQTHPFENQSWLSLCPFKFGGESLSSLTPCVVTFTNSKKGKYAIVSLSRRHFWRLMTDCCPPPPPPYHHQIGTGMIRPYPVNHYVRSSFPEQY
ncbi:hypothetical protein VP01_1533g1 [Puccinia sorghi]|uniref:Uncharacterized protein n=1 Tax=Puccinia sorghi TaxID=27349 RepID=A0A0L6VKC9_9BASI|nr:hypothetical protein VP01_1533g1 [Puccinia sorghi]